MQSTANRPEGHTDWNAVEWRPTYRRVRNLRRRIFRASAEGDRRKVASLQKLMLRSRSNALLAVRRVTQVNRGKNTAGVDKVIVKTPRARGSLVDQITAHEPWKASPARRIYIPKASGKLRPLGIPVVADRAMQAIVLNALEPEWEARFEAVSYGFRPGRGAHDAIVRIYTVASAKGVRPWVLDADIEGAFDNIGHAALLDAIGPFPARELLRQWLKAGYVERGRLNPTDSGTPQGGVISPLLANIALHGMEAALGVRRDCRGSVISSRTLVRYADDFVVFCPSAIEAEAARATLEVWLAARGLKLSATKTRIVHIHEGFDFLGYNVRLYPAPRSSRRGWRLIVKPSKDAVRTLKRRLMDEWRALRGHPAGSVVRRLNPIIRGWANYHRAVNAKETFSSLDQWMVRRAIRHVRRTHPKKNWRWLRERYFQEAKATRDRWLFSDPDHPEYKLRRFGWTAVRPHVLVKGRSSPDDASLNDYWAQRRSRRYGGFIHHHRPLAIAQEGLCVVCREELDNGEELHAHHVVTRREGGSDRRKNLRLVHLYCHQQLHGGRDMDRADVSRLLEPCAGKARTHGSEGRELTQVGSLT